MRIVFIAGLALASAACSTTEQVARVQPLDGVISGSCHIDRVRGAVGLAAGSDVLERIRVDSDSLNLVTVEGGQAPAGGESGGDRVTVQVGAYNRIDSVRCG